METQWKPLTKEFIKNYTRALDKKSQIAQAPSEKVKGYIADLLVGIQRIKSSMATSQAYAFSNSLYVHDNALSEIELSTWRLIEAIYVQNPSLSAPPVTRDQVVDHLKLIIKWTEMYFERTSQGAQDAIRIVQESRSGVMKPPTNNTRTSDPDALFKGVSADDSARDANEKLMHACWELLKAGKHDMVNDLCVASGQGWRAASFFGAGASETLWRMSCFVLSKKMEISAYERAIYGLFSGNYDAVDPVCSTWEERLWAAAHIYLYSVEHSDNMNVDDNNDFFAMLSDDALRREFERVRFSSFGNIFEVINRESTSCGADPMHDVKYAFNRVQEALLVNGELPFSFFANVRLDCDSVLAFNGYQLTRFIVHYINFFAGLAPEKCVGYSEINERMLNVFINDFVEKLFADDFGALAFFVPYYSSFVYASESEKIRFFANKIIDLFDKLRKHETSGSEISQKAMEDFKVALIERNGHDKFGLDKAKVTKMISRILFEFKGDYEGSVRWLTLFMNMRLQTLVQANNSIQDIMLSMDYHVDSTSVVPGNGQTAFDGRDNLEKIANLSRVVKSVPEDAIYLVDKCVRPESCQFAVNMIYEFECHKVCVDALANFSAWEGALSSGNLDAAIKAGEAFERSALTALKYENGLYSYPHFIPQLEAESRLNMLNKMIPNLFYRLLHLYARMYTVCGNKKEVYFMKAKELARLVSLEKYKCYEYFGKDQLLGFLKAFNTFKVEFLSSPSYMNQDNENEEEEEEDLIL